MGTMTWDRGRQADSPKDMPFKGWKDTILRVKEGVSHDRISLISAAMAYYLLFSFVPAITSIVLLYAFFSDPAEISGHISSVSQFLPEELQSILQTQLGGLASKASSTLGFSALFTILFSLWGASKGSKALTEGLNIIYGEEDNRGFLKSLGLSLFLTFLGAVMSLIAMAVIVVYPAVVKLFNLPAPLETIMGFGSWVILLALFSLFLSVAYRYCPCRREPKWKWVSWGAVIASVLWAIASALFSWYAAEFGNFNKTYGSLGAVIVLMTWFYISSFVVLLGGEINAELEHQTKKDSTSGRPRPMGERGAKMADTIGKSASS
jgi:membrane protein